MEIFISNQFHRAGSDAGSFLLEKILGKYIFPRMKSPFFAYNNLYL